MIIDAHTHLIPYLSNPNVVDIKFDWTDLNSWLASEPESKCLVIPTITQFCDSVSLNIRFFEDLNTFSKKGCVFPFLWIHPHQLEEIHFEKFNFSGFKFHPSVSQATIDLNEKTLELCEKHKKPILVHCGRNEKSRIDYVLKINERYPNLNFICAHLGGLATDLIIRAFQKMLDAKYLQNIYLETSGCFHPKLIKKALEIVGSEKIIFGTDRPFHDYKVSLYTIRRCDFDKETRDNVLFKNLQSILSR